MERLTLDHFKQIVAEKYGCKTWETLLFSHSLGFNHEKEYLHEAAELYAEYSRSDQHKIATDVALEWAAELSYNFNKWGWSIVASDAILKGKTYKSLQYGKDNKPNLSLEGNIDDMMLPIGCQVTIEIPIQLVPHIELILFEYEKACKKHPVFAENELMASAILSEETGEVSKAILDHLLGQESKDNIKIETAQVGAVVLRMLEMLKNDK